MDWHNFFDRFILFGLCVAVVSFFGFLGLMNFVAYLETGEMEEKYCEPNENLYRVMDDKYNCCMEVIERITNDHGSEFYATIEVCRGVEIETD